MYQSETLKKVLDNQHFILMQMVDLEIATNQMALLGTVKIECPYFIPASNYD